eukprot:gene6511-15833_t
MEIQKQGSRVQGKQIMLCWRDFGGTIQGVQDDLFMGENVICSRVKKGKAQDSQREAQQGRTEKLICMMYSMGTESARPQVVAHKVTGVKLGGGTRVFYVHVDARWGKQELRQLVAQRAAPRDIYMRVKKEIMDGCKEVGDVGNLDCFGLTYQESKTGDKVVRLLMRVPHRLYEPLISMHNDVGVFLSPAWDKDTSTFQGEKKENGPIWLRKQGQGSDALDAAVRLAQRHAGIIRGLSWSWTGIGIRPGVGKQEELMKQIGVDPRAQFFDISGISGSVTEEEITTFCQQSLNWTVKPVRSFVRRAQQQTLQEGKSIERVIVVKADKAPDETRVQLDDGSQLYINVSPPQKRKSDTAKVFQYNRNGTDGKWKPRQQAPQQKSPPTPAAPAAPAQPAGATPYLSAVMGGSAVATPAPAAAAVQPPRPGNRTVPSPDGDWRQQLQAAVDASAQQMKEELKKSVASEMQSFIKQTMEDMKSTMMQELRAMFREAAGGGGAMFSEAGAGAGGTGAAAAAPAPPAKPDPTRSPEAQRRRIGSVATRD